MNATPQGLIAAFSTPESFLAMLRQARASGYTRLEAYTPFSVEGMEELLPHRPTPMGWIMFVAALLGASGAYFLQWYATHDYPLNVGGRPLNSWPAYIPITFELTVLTAALVGVGALGWLCGLPRLHHPVFAVPGFERASQDRFFVLIRDDDPHFDPEQTRQLFAAAGAETIEEVRP